MTEPSSHQRRRWPMVVAAVLLGMIASLAALAWPHEWVVNTVGLLLVGSQLLALGVVVNPRARGRMFAGVFLAVSAVHCYWGCWQPWDRSEEASWSTAYLRHPTACFWSDLEQTLFVIEIENPSSLLPQYGFWRAYEEDYDIRSVGFLLTSLAVGLLCAAATQWCWRRWRADQSTENRSTPWYQLSLRSLLLYTTLTAVALAAIAEHSRASLRIKLAVDEIEQAEGEVDAEFYPSLFPWFERYVHHEAPQRILSVRTGYEIKDDHLLKLAELPECPELVLHGEITDRGMSYLPRIRGIRTLEIHPPYGDVTDAGLVHLQELPELESLSLDCVDLTDVGLALVARCQNLRTLEVGTHSDHAFSPTSIQQLARLRRLETFEAGNLPIDSQGAELIGQWKNLRELDLSGTNINDEGLRHLRNLTELRLLRLPRKGITADGLQHLGGLTNLHTLDLPDGVSDHLVPWICRNRRMGSLTVARSTISSEGVEQICRLSELVELDLTGAPASRQALASLAQLPKLAQLRIGQTSITDDEVVLLAALPNLRDLNVSDTAITDAALLPFARQSDCITIDAKRTAVTAAGIAQADSLRRSACGVTMFFVQRGE